MYRDKLKEITILCDTFLSLAIVRNEQMLTDNNQDIPINEILHKNTAPGISSEAAIVVPTAHDYCAGRSSRWSVVLLITGRDCRSTYRAGIVVERIVSWTVYHETYHIMTKVYRFTPWRLAARPGSTLSFLTGCPKSHCLGWYRNFLVYCYLKLDNKVVNSTCSKDKLGWIWRADDPECRTLQESPPLHKYLHC